MELKDSILKPYTNKQRAEFVSLNNRLKGYEIRETETELQAWGYTEGEKEEQQKIQRNSEIDSKIKELQEMSLTDIMNNNKDNIKIYNDVISGLELSRP